MIHLRRNSTGWSVAAVAGLSVLFLYLRIGTIGHPLMWDEAWNILSLKAFLLNFKASPFFWHYYTHPPCYMNFAAFLKPFSAGIDIRMEWLSLLCAYGTFLVMYLLSYRIGGRLYAFLSGLSLSVMPYSIGYDTWIKRDGLASFFGYLAFVLLIKKRFFWCAVSLSFSLLSKESALFFIAAATIMIPLLNGREGFKKLVMPVYPVIFLMTSWWYIFCENIREYVIDMYFTENLHQGLSGNTHLLYLRQLLPDMGAALFVLLALGTVYSVYRIFYKKQFIWSLPLAVVLCTYIPISVMLAVEFPWYALSARPALAMIAGGGAFFLFKTAARIKLIRLVPAVIMLYAVFLGCTFSYNRYHETTYPSGWPGAIASKQLAEYLNSNMKEDDKLLMSKFAYWDEPQCVVFAHYSKHTAEGILAENMTAEDIIKLMEKEKISWLVIAAGPESGWNIWHELAGRIRQTSLGAPRRVGWAYVWRMEH